jgi:hypothetical protein
MDVTVVVEQDNMNDHPRKILMFSLVMLLAQDGMVISLFLLCLYMASDTRKVI